MRVRIRKIKTAIPDLHAIRSRLEEPYVGMKETFLIARLEEGRSEFWTHGKLWRGAAGSIVVHQPGDVCRDVARDGPMTFQIIRPPAGTVVRVPSVLAVDEPRAAPLHRLHDAVAANADRFALECALAEAVCALNALSDVRDRNTRPVRRALTLLRERISEPVTLDELAVEAGMDKFHLCRAFRAQVGMPPHAYLTRLRILRAKELLLSGARPADVAMQVGLYDQSQLNRHFRRLVGVTPGEFARAASAPWLHVPPPGVENPSRHETR